jgi:hypothetical protein
MSTAVATTGNQSFSLSPRNIDEAMRFADLLSKASLVPKDFANNPGNILVAIQWGLELGLQPMQAMQNIAVINGRPSLWGDAVIALVKACPACEYVVEEISDDSATCRVKRAGEPEQSRTFSRADAKTAGLLGKQGPWSQYPKRMLQMRARSWALRDVFPDVLRGLAVAEEALDMEVDVSYAQPAKPKRLTGTQAAEQAKQQTAPDEADPARAELIRQLEGIATEFGEAALREAWGNMSGQNRNLVGIAERDRIKKMAADADAERSEQTAEAAEEVSE